MKLGYLLSLLLVLHLALLITAGEHQPKHEHEDEDKHGEEVCDSSKIIKKLLEELKEVKHELKELRELRAKVHHLEEEISSKSDDADIYALSMGNSIDCCWYCRNP